MKKITDRGRKILGNIFRVISVSAASLILHACYGVIPPEPEPAMYGPPPPNPPDYVEKTSISGKVVSSNETDKPIFGIKISIEGTEYQKRTDEDGCFYFSVPIQDVYKLKLEDIDGPYNGGLFKEKTWTLKQNDTYNTLLIGMDLDN